jgi:DNA-binding beta-propeller fold protein YncE
MPAMSDLNNRPGGPNLIVTAKTAHKVHFLDAATLTTSATIDMPGSTHELALSADDRTAYGSVYGDGIFARRVNPDRRIAVIDLPSQSLTRVIDLGAVYAPHGVMMDNSGMLWSSAELGNAVLMIDPMRERVQSIDVGATAHWVAISHATGRVFVSVKQDYIVVIDIVRRTVLDRIKLPARGRGRCHRTRWREALCLRADGRRILRHRCANARRAANGCDRRRERRQAADAARARLT